MANDAPVAVRIDAAFPGANILVVDDHDPAAIQLAIRPDTRSPHLQSFYFAVLGAAGIPCRLIIGNAAAAMQPDGWTGYRAVGTDDADATWRRLPTTYDDGRLVIEVVPASDRFEVAAFAPYRRERELALIRRTVAAGGRHEVLDTTPHGRPLDALVIGPDGAPPVWITARQHPGEVMAQWCADGLVSALLAGGEDAQAVLRETQCWIVPNMNPDGSALGHHRTNATGVDLNRAWADPLTEAPVEVAAVKALMMARPPRLWLDLHGDEVMEHVFLVAPEGPAGDSAPIAAVARALRQALQTRSADFSPDISYPKPPPDAFEQGIGVTWASEALGTPAFTLELPFNDVVRHPDSVHGWSPERAQHLGAQLVGVIRDIAPVLAASARP
jgi:murein tripeptide amidase MpaA